MGGWATVSEQSLALTADAEEIKTLLHTQDVSPS